MRSHARASTAGSTKRQARGLGRIFRGAFATRDGSRSDKGSGAPKSRRLALSLALLVALLSMVFAVGSATAVAPTVVSTSASTVTSKAVLLEAEINPGGEATTYHFEYGLADCASNPCTSTPSANVGSGSSAVKITREVEGLSPQTTYHFRVVANNGSGPAAGPDRTFKTYAASTAEANCPNQAVRYGASVSLPDCRAYEMVSPVDKNGGDITPTAGIFNRIRAAYNQSSVDGNKFTYSALTAFAGAVSGRGSNQYMASRGADGWVTRSINAPFGQTVYGGTFLPNAFGIMETQFKLFTPDLANAWVMDVAKTPFLPDAAKGFPNLYRRDNVNDVYETITKQAPTSSAFVGDYHFDVQGHSSDFSHIVFVAPSALTANAGSGEQDRLYDATSEGLHLVSLLPNGNPTPVNANAGNNRDDGEHFGAYQNAISHDGSRIFWTSSNFVNPNGTLYLRKNPDQPESAQQFGSASGSGSVSNGSNEITSLTTSTGAFAVGQTIIGAGIPADTTITAVNAGENKLTLSAPATNTFNPSLESYSDCTEPEKACTVPISGPASQGQFWAASDTGSSVIYSNNGLLVDGTTTLFEFDVDTEVRTPIAGEVSGVVGASEDLSHIYFVSKEALDAGATAGEPNLYLDHDGTITFIATVAPGDTGSPANAGFNPATIDSAEGLMHASRVTPDGRYVAFESVRSLTGYDNTDAVNGKAAMEVYLYEADSDKLICASCNPSGARPVGEPLRIPYVMDAGITETWAAAWLQTHVHNLYASHALSSDGNRLFFNSFDALVPQDSNGVQDVYQWEAQGSGTCQEAGGCISLISTGKSEVKSEFVDATPNGNDVFFETRSDIDPRDPGLIDIYNARVGGGFSVPSSPPACIGDACQSVPPAPNDPTPASAGFRGAGNPAPPKSRRKCRARPQQGGKAKRHAKHKRAKRCAQAKRRAGR